MGQSTLLAFGLVLIAIIQSNAAPSPTAPVSTQPGADQPCAVGPPSTLPIPSNHPLTEYEKSAKALKNWIEDPACKNAKGAKGLTRHGNGEGCLPAVGAGEQYYEGYVPFENAKRNNRGKGTGKGKCKAPFINGDAADGPARVIVKVLADGKTVDGTWYYTIGHYAPGFWSAPQHF